MFNYPTIETADSPLQLTALPILGKGAGSPPSPRVPSIEQLRTWENLRE